MQVEMYLYQKPTGQARRHYDIIALAMLVTLGVALLQYVVRANILTATTDTVVGHLFYILRDSLILFIPALIAVSGSFWLAQRMEIGRKTWSDLWQHAAIVSLVFMLFLLLFAPFLPLIRQALAVTGESSVTLSWNLEIVINSLRDALIGQVIALPLAMLAQIVSARRRGKWPQRESYRRRRGLPPGGFAILLLGIVFLGGLMFASWDVSPSYAETTFSNVCTTGGVERIYDISAINVDITLNQFGDHDPEGLMYVLDENIAAVRVQEAARTVTPGLRDDPIQSLVVRANMEECLVVNFTNQLVMDASFHIHGIPFSIDNAGGEVGANSDTFAAPGQSVTYRLPMPTDPDTEGGYYFHSHGSSRQQTAHGLFGTLVVEPAGSQYLHPETLAPLKSGWEAIIVDPSGVNFREFTVMFHEIGDEDYEILDINDDKLPVIDDKLSGAYRPGSRALNYRSEPFYDRFKLRDDAGLPFDKAHGYSSYSYGDPATPIPRSYLGEPTKTRLMHGGSELFHVYHLHGGAIRWRRNPNADDTDIDGGLQKTPIQNAISTRLDSQSIGPGDSFSLEHECGAGGCQQAAGDFLWHCHIGHHYVAGMWSFWRVFDTAQPDLATIPADAPAPTAVNSLGLVGQIVEGKELVPAADLTDPSTQQSLEEWIEQQLPPAGVPLDDVDATVWNWQKINTASGPLYLGEPETSQVWPNYASATPGQRPEIMFNPTNGRYTWPLFKPHLGQRPPFSANGHSGAPWLGEDVTSERPDGLCPSTVPNYRYYPITAIDLPIQVTSEKVDDAGMIFTLSEEKDDIRNGLRPAEPLAIRSNVGDCVDIILTSEQLDANHNGYAKVNMHIHFVQFDPQASDGVITGYSYEQSIRPYATENRTLVTAVTPTSSGGPIDIDVNQVDRLRVGIFIGIGLGDFDVEVRKIVAINGTTITLDEPLENDHAAGAAVGVEFVRYRWYSDVDSGTIFFHDHVNFKNWDHGLFGAHIVEPAGSTYHDPVTGEEVRSGTMVDIHTNGRVGWGPAGIGSFRELMLFIHNGNPATGDDSGATFNMRAEPLGRRDGGPAHIFSSVTNGDPFTPILRAYVGDPVVFRGIGLVERVGSLRVTGHRFRIERFAGDGALSDAASIGISEKEDMVLDGGAGGPAGMSGDYLFYSGIARDFVGGAWGILRVHDTEQGSLQPLPDRAAPPTGAGFPQLTFTGGAPPQATDSGAVCPVTATVRSYEAVIFQTDISYFPELGGTDIDGVIYALAADEQDILDGVKRAEPLVLRVNDGECLQIGLTNHLSERASLSVGKLLFDPQGSYGAAIGYNPDSTVAPGNRYVYHFYADQELGTNIMMNLANPELGARGAFGMVIVEPAGAIYRDSHTGEIIESGVYADIISSDGSFESFREYAVMFQDEDDRIGGSTMPYKTEVEGFSGINYIAVPFAERLAVNPDPAKIYDSDVHGDPATYLETYAGDPLRYRVAMAWGEQGHMFSMEGHRWYSQPNMVGSNQVSASILLPGMAYDAHIVDGAGSGISSGDYLYQDHRQPFLEAGMWGVMRVYDPNELYDLLPLSGPSPTATPVPPTATDTPVAPPTDTPVPPTATDTPVAPPTDTPVPPTATDTPVPPTATDTPSSGSTFTFNPVADSIIRSNRSNNNYGTQTRLGVDDTPDFLSYLRFDVTGLDGPISSATLRLYIESGSTPFDVLEVADDSWGETTITYNNAPALGTTVNGSGSVSTSSWISVDVTSYITGEGLHSLAVDENSGGRTMFSSREGSNAPELIIETGSGGGATATPEPVTVTSTPEPSTPTPEPATPTPEPPTPTPSSGSSLHIGDLGGATTSSGSRWTTTVTITVHDENEAVVVGATVDATWSFGSRTTSTTCDTDVNGQCEISVTMPSFISEIVLDVDNVTGSSLYVEADNHDPDGDSDGISIIVSAP